MTAVCCSLVQSTAVCCSFWVLATGADWSGMQLGGAKDAVDCAPASEEPWPKSREGWAGGMDDDCSVPLCTSSRGKRTKWYRAVLRGTRRYEMVPGGTKGRGGSVEVLKR